jgi:transposase
LNVFAKSPIRLREALPEVLENVNENLTPRMRNRRGREFAAWLGLLPNQHSTGGKVRLYGISKRGNCYLRKILIHGARAVVLRSKRDRIAMGAWMTSLETRAPRNVLIVATAHKLARIAWAVLSTGQDYRAVPEALTV